MDVQHLHPISLLQPGLIVSQAETRNRKLEPSLIKRIVILGKKHGESIIILILICHCCCFLLHWREPLLEDTHSGHPSLSLFPGYWRVSPFLFTFFFLFSQPFMFPSLSLSFLFPTCSFQHGSGCVSCAEDPAHASPCMWARLTFLRATNAHAINHGHGNMIPLCISLESTSYRTPRPRSVGTRMWKILLCHRPCWFPVCKSKPSCDHQIHLMY